MLTVTLGGETNALIWWSKMLNHRQDISQHDTGKNDGD